MNYQKNVMSIFQNPAITNYLMACAILIIGLLNVFFAEKIPVSGGFGWDGVLYGHVATNLPELVNKQLNSYYLGRIVPPGIVHFALRAFCLPLSTSNIIRGFDFLNLFWLILSAYVWGQIADELKCKTKAKWFGWIALFVNYWALKQNAYYPVLTDTSAFGIGMLMLFAYLKNRFVFLWLITFVGAFTWPTLIYCGILLLVFPKKPYERLKSSLLLSWFTVVTAMVTSIVVTMAAIYVHYILQYREIPPVDSVVFLSFCVLAIYILIVIHPIFFNLLPLVKAKYLCEYLLRWGWIARLFFASLLLAIVKFLTYSFASGPGATMSANVIRFLELSVTKPLVFWLDYVVFYGPIIIIATFTWRKTCLHMALHGPGLLLVILMGILLSISPESRQLINFFPFLVPFVVKVIEDMNFKLNFYVWFLMVSFLSSKVWININTGLIIDSNYMEFPWQKYFGSYGPWMSNEMYVVQGGLVLVIAMFFYFEFFKQYASSNNKI